MTAQMASVVGSGGTTTGSDRAENDMLGLEQRARELAHETGGGDIPIREPVKFVKATDSQEQTKVSLTNFARTSIIRSYPVDVWINA